jgi:enterochelin esterase-like enzyme
MEGRLLVIGCMLGILCVPGRGAIIESCLEDVAQARGREFRNSKGGPENNKLENTNTPVRAGATAFKHWVNTKGERSELAMVKTEIGGTYWYGWSMLLPKDFDPSGSKTIVMQLATYPTPRNGKFPCKANGSFIHLDPQGRLVFHLQHKGDDKDMVCDEFTILDDVAKTRGRWIDFVMHAKWTGDPNGFLQFWVKVDDNNYFQRIDYQGRTFWNDEDKGPYFKMGAYMGEPGWKGPPERTVYTDEYRLGDATSSFDEVAPEAQERHTQAGKGCVEYLTYRSALNKQDIAIIVYTPPGYDVSGPRLPVVYNLHGAGGGSPARQWDRVHETLTRAIEEHQVRPMIYVFVNGLGDTFYIDYADGTLKVESSIIQELIPSIDARYRTIASRGGRAIDGFSMGGAGALTLALKHPDLFSSVVSYGAAVIDGARESARWPTREHFEQYSAWGAVKRNADQIRNRLRIRMVCGDQDGLFGTNLKFQALLDELKIPVDWVTVPGVAHDTRGLYRRVGVESLRFMEAGFGTNDTAARAQPAGKQLPPTKIAKWSVHELTLEAARTYDNPYVQAGVTAVFTAPDGREISVRGFWDGDNAFRIRFTPDMEGHWRSATQSEDEGLTGWQGTLQCDPPASDVHGFLRRDPAHAYHWVWDDGTRFFMFGQTYYELISNARAGASWQAAIDNCRKYGINKVRFRLYIKNCGNAINPAPCTEPWLEDNRDRLDLAHWRATDQIIQYLNRVGMVADLMPFNSSEKAFGTPEQDARLLRYVIARYAAYPNLIWCLTNEFQRTGRPREYLNSLGAQLHAQDPWLARGEFLRPLSIHPLGGKGEGDYWKFADQPWPVHVILQYGRLTPGDALYNAQVDNRKFNMPVVNDEFGYMGDSLWRDARGDRGSDTNHYTPEAHRQTMWAICMAGTYASSGDKNQYEDGRPYQSATWHERPEYREIAALIDLFTTKGLEYWKMAPQPSAVEAGTRVYVLAAPGRQYIAYAAAGGAFTLRVAPGRYAAKLYDPRDGSEEGRPDVNGGQTVSFATPAGQDWVVYLKLN